MPNNVRQIGGYDREDAAERRRDRRDLEMEHRSNPMPATCGGCGAPIYVVLSPTLYNSDDGTTPHRCRRSASGRQRLRSFEKTFEQCDERTRLRKQRARR